MTIAIVGSGGKTTLLKALAEQYRAAGKTVFVTTTTRMFREANTLLTDDAAVITRALQETGYAMAGIPEGQKIRGLSPETYAAVRADVVLVEADGSKQLPLKFPNATEPVIPPDVDEIYVVSSLDALGRKAEEVCHRLELVKACLGIENHTPITRDHVQTLLTEGYLRPLREKYPHVPITVALRQGDTFQMTHL